MPGTYYMTFFVKLHDIMIDDYNALLFGGGEVFMIWSSR